MAMAVTVSHVIRTGKPRTGKPPALHLRAGYLLDFISALMLAIHGNGAYWCMYAKDGDKLHLHTVSTFKFSAPLGVSSE